MGRARHAGGALLAVAMLTVCAPPNDSPRGCGLEGSKAPAEGTVAEVAFTCYFDPPGRYHGDVLVMRPGERAHLLTHGEGVNGEPRWSRDGSRIAFTSTRSGTPQVYVVNADGTGLTQVTHAVSFKGGEDWSPDGAQIVYFSSEAGLTGAVGIGHYPGDLYVSRIDGGGPRRLTSGGSFNSDASWSPDGSRIAFYSDRGGPGEIWLMDADGGNLHRLTEGPALNARPGWSPDGTQIVFHSERDYPRGYESGIYVMNADGSDQHMVTRSGVAPDWSADGRWIVFTDRRDGRFQLYATHPDGSGLTRLTSDSTVEWQARWRPN